MSRRPPFSAATVIAEETWHHAEHTSAIVDSAESTAETVAKFLDTAVDRNRHVIEHGEGPLARPLIARRHRARVAATAPEALRMLMLLEWGDDGRCLFCGNGRRDGHGHAGTCALAALLRKAGAR